MKRAALGLAAALAMLMPLLASADTETVDGIVWTYGVTDGKASVGGGSSSSPAIPKATTGAVMCSSRICDAGLDARDAMPVRMQIRSRRRRLGSERNPRMNN